MPWFDSIIPDYIKKSVCTCLIKRYLSQFIENEIRRDQLNVDLYNGRGTAERISLAVESINELGEAQNWPFEFVDGYIEKIDIIVPWTNILKESASVEITGLKITVQPKQRNEDATSMFESMWNSMTSSMHLAEEFAKEEQAAAEKAQVFEGIELFAQTIENIVGRIKIKFVDTTIQMEHVPKESVKGVGILINIELMEYSDESGNDPTVEETTDLTNEDSKKAYLINSFTTKKLSIEGVKLSTVEFSSCARTCSRSLIESRISDQNEADTPKEDETFFDADIEEQERPSRKSSNNSLDDFNSKNDRHIIICGQFTSRQEVRIKLKQSEDLAGPKVAIEVNLGFLNLFISPRQFHIIIELISGFSTPSMEDTSNVAPRQKAKSKQMTDDDYQKVEEELQHLLNPFTNLYAGNLQGTHGWSTGPMDESSDSFLPMKDNVGGMYDSNISGVSSSMESSIASSTASFSTEQSQQTRRRVSNIDADPTAEISRFQIRLASIAVVLLHEDLITGSTGNEYILVKHMQNIAKEFFDKLHYVTPLAFNSTEADNIRKAFDNACRLNHIRLFAAPVQIEADEKTTSSAFSMTGQLTASKLELLECLYADTKIKYIPLLQFDTRSATESPLTLRPSVRLKLKHVQKTGRSRVSKKAGPRTDLTVSLNKCTVECDISIVDRIATLLNHPPICSKEEKFRWDRNHVEPQFVTTPVVDSRLDVKVTSSLLNLKLMFPVPDFRPPHDMSKCPWWERNVRQDYLSLALADVTATSVFHTSQTYQEYTVESAALNIYYYESENSEGLHIGKCGTDERFSSVQDASSNIRLSIKICPKQVDLEDCVPSQDPMLHSCYGVLENQSRSQPGPFSAKRVVHESDTPHSKQFKGTSTSHDAEELLIPGDKVEIDEFIKSTSSNTQIYISIFLPTISAHLKSKHIYELLYNRINNDLLLWESGAPKPNITVESGSSYYGTRNFEGPETFLMCKSGIQYESESESDDSNSENTNVFYSTYDSKMKNRKINAIFKPEMGTQSYLVFNLKIGQGLLGLNPLVRDAATNNVIPGQQGELLFNIQDADVFVVSGYRGDDNLGYVCVQMQSAFLYHCDIQPEPSSSPPLREITSIVGKKLYPTVYKSDVGALGDCKNRGGSRKMFTVAVKIQANHETHHVKTIQVSLGLNKATLRHRLCNEPNTWISHLLDFFNVQDYPIPGYCAKDVLTELHLHLWDCAIDYRPLHLPIRALVSLGNFSLSSHLTAVANTSTLRFIFEECGLFLSEKSRSKDGVDLKRDYVNVIDLGLFELSLKTTDKKIGKNPHIDLRAFNNKIIIRTCSDSGRALMQLITYYANDGDLTHKDESQKDVGSTFSSPKHEAEAELLSKDSQEALSLCKAQQKQVSEMLVDAIEDSDKNKEVVESELLVAGADMFFFADEKDVNQQAYTKPLKQVITELGDVPYQLSKNSDTDDEFCIVGNEPGLGLFPKDGVPEITIFSPVKVIDNHFSIPVGKRDLFQPPKDFPTPVTRYTLCEMTVVWQMYGGNDFKVSESESNNKQVRFSETQLSDTVSFSKKNKHVTINNNLGLKKDGMEWKLRGGENRDHSMLMEVELTKLRFQHEVYPENTEQASRQVLLVSDLEIRDKLDIKISKIHKFLYQFDSETKPKKSNSNMVVIKALHIRPDLKLKAQECCLKISLLPLRLNIDQDALLFLINFFKELGGGTDTETAAENTEEPASKQNSASYQPPVMTISVDNEEEMKQQAQKAVNDNLILLMEESKMYYQPEDQTSVSTETIKDETPVYFRKVVFSPDVFIRLDYNGKRVDMSHGPLAGLLLGLGQLKCSELRLKRIIYRHGLLGFSKLCNHLLQEWLTDIKRNQLGTILGGVGPMHALLQVFQGVRDLIWLPIEQYQKDGRIIRGLRRGANSFTTLTAMAALELTTRIINLIQLTAETAFDMLSPGPSIRTRRLAKTKGRKKRYHQPQDIREGFTNACLVVRQGFGETADNIVQVASLEKEQKGYSGAVGGVLRQIPPTILKPIIIASEATTNVLGGMQCQLLPDVRREANQKWKTSD